MSQIIHLPGVKYIKNQEAQVLGGQESQKLIWKLGEKASGSYDMVMKSKSLLEPSAFPAPTSVFSPQPVYGGYYSSHPYIQTPQAAQRPSSNRRRRRPPHSYASLIAQALLTSKDQRLTLRDIYEWIQTRYPLLYESNETGWQNTIRHNLSLNKCFKKLPRVSGEKFKGKGNKGGYWTVDLEQLNNTNFGRQILDCGFLSNIEYWHQQQEEQKQDDKEYNVPSLVEDMDFTSFYQSSNERYTTETEDKMSSFLDKLGSKRPSDSISSKTSSARGSASPQSPATTDFESTPNLPSEQPQKIDIDPLLNPSLMRVNNILN